MMWGNVGVDICARSCKTSVEQHIIRFVCQAFDALHVVP